MSRPWMPFYIAEYLGDTGHLNTTQHGAYFLLIIHYWRMRGLPEDDRQLANITKLPLRIWLDIKPVIRDFFVEGWKHKRIEKELAKQDVIVTKRSMAGQKGGAVTAQSRFIAKQLSASSKRPANARQTAPPNEQQMPGKGVAITITDTNKNSSLGTESERSEATEPTVAPQGATEEAAEKRPPEFSRRAFDETLEARRKASA